MQNFRSCVPYEIWCTLFSFHVWQSLSAKQKSAEPNRMFTYYVAELQACDTYHGNLSVQCFDPFVERAMKRVVDDTELCFISILSVTVAVAVKNIQRSKGSQATKSREMGERSWAFV